MQLQTVKKITGPLSFNQQALWFLYQIAPESSCYNVALACRIVSEMQPAAMREASRKLMKRHEVLRTTYSYNSDSDGGTCQTIHPEMEPAFYLMDASGFSDGVLKAKVKAFHSRPFDLENGPLLRLALFQRNDAEYIFVMTIHHIACDGKSLGIMMNDLGLLYRAEVEGADAGLPACNWCYRDFIRYQRNMLQGEDGPRLRDFWKKQLSGSLPVMDLPFDYERPAIHSFTGASYTFHMAGILCDDIRKFVKGEKVSRYVFLLAVFQATLWHCCHQDDVIVGIPAGGRIHPEFEGICGYFANMIAIRGDLSGDLTFQEHLQRSQKTVSRAQDHQEYPFLLLVEKLAVERDSSLSPVFQVMFNLLNLKTLGVASDFVPGASHDIPVDFGGLKIMPWALNHEEGQFDLALEIIDREESLACVLKYRPDLFKEETIATVAELFQNCLQQFMEEPGMRLMDSQFLYAMGKERKYWKSTLQGSLPVLQLPTDYSRTVGLGYRSSASFFELTLEQTAGLMGRSKGERVENFVLLLTIYMVLLSRYSGQREVIVGVPSLREQGTNPARTERDYRHMLPVRVDLTESCTFNEALHLIRETSLEALSHNGLPFRKLVEEVGGDLPLDHHPVFQAMFSFQDSPLSRDECTEQPLFRGWHGSETGCDLTLCMWDEENRWHGAFIYNEALFKSDTIERMRDSFQVLVKKVSDGGNEQLRFMPMLSCTEREKLISGWNDNARDYPSHMCLHHIFDVQVEKTPDAVAVSFENTDFTYRKLCWRANQLANHLRRLGVGPEKLVGVFMERSIEMVVAIYGILKAGGAYVPLDPDYPAERIAYMMEDTDVQVVLTQSRLKADFPENSATVICLDTEWERVAEEGLHPPVSGVTADNLAYVLYTSGSTGKPKGVMNTHKGICNRVYWMQDEYRLTASDRILQKTPYSFDVSVWEFFWPLLFGARLIVAPPGVHKDPVSLIRLIRNQKVSTLHFVPSMLQLFLREKQVETCTSLKRVICSGEALSCGLRDLFFERLDAGLHNLYGPTEAAVDVTFWECLRGSKRLSVPIGKPVSNTQIYILDKYMQPVPVGVPGELHIGGVQVARGYLNRPKLTEEKFVQDPFRNDVESKLYKTGDLCRYLSDGCIEYIGREDFQVKMNGVRLELGEIEAVLSKHSLVTQAIVSIHEIEPGDKRLFAYYTQGNTSKRLMGELRRFLSGKLPGYMVPSQFIPLDTMPLTSSGKVDRKNLPVPGSKRPEVDQEYLSPQNELEEIISEVWRKVLKVDSIGVTDRFFEVGGNSLLGVRVIGQLGEVLSRDIPVINLFKYPTIESFADYLSRKTASDALSEKILGRAKLRRRFFEKRKDSL